MPAASAALRPWSRTIHALTRLLAILSLFSLALEYGFETPPIAIVWLHALQIAAGVSYALWISMQLVSAPAPERLRGRRLEAALVVAAAIALALRCWLEPAACLATLQVCMLLGIGIALLRIELPWARWSLAPGRALASVFLTVILVGGTMLWALPTATAPELSHQTRKYFAWHVLNCYFTATGATCVTGLTIYDLETDFTLLGQIVILAMMQIGGVAMMTFGSIFGMRVAEAAAPFQVRRIVRGIIGITLLLEAIGAVLLCPMWPDSVGGPLMRAYYSVFHAVSAFCNAGFALNGNNLIPYARCWGVYASIMPLIVLGGLGYPVLADLLAWARTRFRSRLSLHAQCVLLTTGVLVLGGALLLFATESVDRRSSEERRQSDARRDDSSTAWAGARLPHGERAAAALFQSVSARSTGFRTVRLDAESFSSAGQLVLWSLMFIGGAPGSTAGGVKTVTVFAVVVAAVGALRGRRAVTAFGRTIPPDVLWRAGLVMLGMLGLMALTALLLSLTEHAPLPQLIFESVSAANSAGLSTGLTPRLTVAGKIIIMLSMFSGRLGPLILALAATGGAAPARGDYPEESVVIG